MLTFFYNLTHDLIIALQSTGEWLFTPMEFFTFLGTENFYLILLPILAWFVDYGFGLRIGVMLLLTSGINNIFKMALHQPRPYWYFSDVKNLTAPETGFGVPSGHSQSPASIYGLIAASVKRRWVTIVMAVLIFLIGFSRLVLGVHFLQDILIGWTIGLILVWLFVKYEDKFTAWLGKFSMGGKIGIVFVISLVFIAIGALVVFSLGDYQVPQAWQDNAAVWQPDDSLDPVSLNAVITSGATLFGLACGAFWVNSRGGFDAKSGEWWQFLLRLIVGLVGVIALWMGLDMVFPGEKDLISYVLRYVRYGLVGFWVAGLGPVLFEKLGLVGKKE
jgi:membrane-associated phospholipid phosphatase